MSVGHLDSMDIVRACVRVFQRTGKYHVRWIKIINEMRLEPISQSRWFVSWTHLKIISPTFSSRCNALFEGRENKTTDTTDEWGLLYTSHNYEGFKGFTSTGSVLLNGLGGVAWWWSEKRPNASTGPKLDGRFPVCVCVCFSFNLLTKLQCVSWR